MIVTNPGGPCSSNTGSANGSGTPKLAREGPIARKRTGLDAVPLIMNPPMPALSPFCTSMRVERLTGCDAGLGAGVGDGAAARVVTVKLQPLPKLPWSPGPSSNTYNDQGPLGIVPSKVERTVG